MDDDLEQPRQPRGWHSRGRLPHFDGGPLWQFITLHLGDALPQEVLERWQRELEHEPDLLAQKLLTQRIERYLDCGYGACYLRRPQIAEEVQKSLWHFDAERYRLSAWVIMPNHTHFLLQSAEGIELSDIMRNHKSFTAHKCNKMLGRTGSFWQLEYYDRYIRDADHYRNVVRYIENNPVKARLGKKPSD
jgi:REP element-mobilizing transposase RayT